MTDTLAHDIRATYTIWFRDVLRFFKDRMRIVGSLAMPLIFLFIFGSGLAAAMSGLAGGIDYKQYLFPGILAMTTLFTAVFSALSIVWDREFGFLREVMVAPVSRTAVAIGKMLGGSTVAMIQGAIVLALAPAIGVSLSVGQVFELLGLMLLLALVMSSFGMLVGARQKSMEGFQMVMNFLLMPMLFVSGAFFPIEGAPRWLEIIAKINPVTYGVDPLRQVALRGSMPPEMLAQMSVQSVGVDVLITLGFIVAFTVPAIMLFAKQD